MVCGVGATLESREFRLRYPTIGARRLRHLRRNGRCAAGMRRLCRTWPRPALRRLFWLSRLENRWIQGVAGDCGAAALAPDLSVLWHQGGVGSGGGGLGLTSCKVRRVDVSL